MKMPEKKEDPTKEGERHKPSAESKENQAPPQDEIVLPRAEYESLLARLNELEGMKEKLLRSAADFDNAKKRLLKEREEFIKFSQENLIRQLLPILDNFERALAHAGEVKDSSVKGIVSGIQMVYKQVSELLKNQGLKRLKVVGEKFDPHLHEAVGHAEQEGREDEIVEEIEAGYSLHDRLLRAAKVRVRVSPSSKKKFQPQEEKQEEIT